MAKFKFDQAITILANLGVIAGLIFVGLQLQQDREMTANELLGTYTDSHMNWSQSIGPFSELWAKGLAGESLTDSEALLFDSLAFAWEGSHYSRFAVSESLSLSDPARFPREWAYRLHSYPGLMRWWQEYNRIARYTNPKHFDGEWYQLIEQEREKLASGSVVLD